MGKNDTALIVGGLIAAFLLTRDQAKGDIPFLPGGGGGFNLNLGGGLLGGPAGGLGLPEDFEFPPFPEFPGWPELPGRPELPGPLKITWPKIPGIPDFIPDIPGIPDPRDIIPEVPDIPLPDDVVSDVTMPQVIGGLQNLVGKGGTLYARQAAGAVLTGTTTIKPLPFASKFRNVGKVLTNPALRKAATTAVPRVGVKVGLRAVPVLGWTLLGVDIAADIARLFGADVTEWLGISPIISSFSDQNLLEKTVSEAMEDGGVTFTEGPQPNYAGEARIHRELQAQSESDPKMKRAYEKAEKLAEKYGVT